MLAAKLCKYSFRFPQIIRKNGGLLFKGKNNFNLIGFSSRYISLDNEYKALLEISDNFPEIPEPPSCENFNVLSEPTFASLGLNNYTPAGLVQFILENVHITLGLPWWACIAITAVLIRSLTVPILLGQRRLLINAQNSIGVLTKLSVDAIQARESGNSLLMIQKLKEFDKITEQDNFNLFKHFKPILIQAPIFISVFTALRGMANANVPSLMNGGLWWFLDLTAYDPYFVLPLIAAGSLHLIMESNITSATTPAMKWCFRLAGPLVFVVLSQFPATLVLYWSFSNTYSLIFSLLLKRPDVKKALEIPELIPQPQIDNPKGYGLRESMELLRSQHEVYARERTSDLRFTKEEQKYVLDRGVAAAAIRKKMKDKIQEHDKSTINVTGQIVEKGK